MAWRSALGLASLGSDIHTTAVMAGIQKLLRDETDGVEVLVEPESTPCRSWSMWHSCFSCNVRQRTPARHSSLSWLAAESLCGTCWNQLAPYMLRKRPSQSVYRKVAPVLVMYKLVTGLLKLGQVAFSSAGSW